MYKASVTTYTATIYAGLRCGPELYSTEDARRIIREFVNARVPHPELPGGCVTVTPTEFIYSHGEEPGIAVGLINYPRFPSTAVLIREAAMELAERLRCELRQRRVSVVFPDETVMIED